MMTRVIASLAPARDLRILTCVFALVAAACGSSKQHAAPAPLTDITADSIGAVRTTFNAHKGEARFLTLLSPT
jgi:hypothetical protein